MIYKIDDVLEHDDDDTFKTTMIFMIYYLMQAFKFTRGEAARHSAL